MVFGAHGRVNKHSKLDTIASGSIEHYVIIIKSDRIFWTASRFWGLWASVGGYISSGNKARQYMCSKNLINMKKGYNKKCTNQK